jgi:hypothetical protein
MLVSIIGLTSCEYEFIEVGQPDPDIEVSFSEMIAPIFSGNNCTACHSAGGTPPNLATEQAYNSIVPALIDADAPESSRIYMVPAPSSNHPAKYTPAQAALVLAWINQGALNN